ncbi:MAG: HAD family hydrolase [Acidobacteriota bacterium]|nr:HAD family hydrolase [Acidobacteriota bacterium]
MIEIVRSGVSARATRVALFDFDGTLSLVRSGWMDVMIPMMTGLLADLDTGESESELRGVVEDYVGRLTGQETVYQMIALAEEISKRGGKPLDPLVYKRMYLDRLWDRIKHRVAELRGGQVPPERYLVPGSRALLEDLKRRGFTLYLASGTDEEYMMNEARLLDVERYFDGGVYGALDDYQNFSKAILIQRILHAGEFRGDQFLAFGDGYVEIENVKEVGGIAVGVATAEPDCRIVDQWKRQRLINAGADFIIPNFECRAELTTALFGA